MRVPVHLKITLSFCLITACLLIGAYQHLKDYLETHTYNRIHDRMAKELSLSRAYLEDHCTDPLDYTIDTVADHIGTMLACRITIIAANGTVYGDSELDGTALRQLENHAHRPEVRQAWAHGFGESRRYSTTLKQDMLYMATVFSHGKLHGIIRLAVPLADITQVVNRLQKTLYVAFFIMFIAMLIIGHVTSLFISKPLKKLSAFTRNIGAGDYTQRIHVATHDEIADCAAAFNDMAQQINENINEITQHKSRLEAVFASMIDGVIVVDTKGTIILMNDALKKTLLIDSPPEGRQTIEVIRNMHIQELIESALTAPTTIHSREITLLHPAEKILLIHATPIIRNDTVDGVVLVFHDITELRHLENIRKDFVANVSHELRTPIATIKGYAETLLDGALDEPENAREFLTIIMNDADRLAQLINDLLDLSKIESGALELKKTQADLKPLIERAVVHLQKALEEKSISLTVDLPDTLQPVLCDPDCMLQVFMNLIDNAIKYNKPNGSITVSAQAVNNHIEIAIRDTGIGIPEKDLPRIFERFYRVDKAHSRHLGGTGLGLSIVKHIIQAHNGTISIHSILGSETTIRFSLPVK